MTKLLLNPKYEPRLDLGNGSEPDAVKWDALKTKVTAFLEANADKSSLVVDDVRKVDAALTDDRVWGQIAADLDLLEIAERE